MKIAVWYNLPSGGAKRALHDQVLGLVERGHDLEFYTPTGPGLDYLPLRGYGKEHLFPSVDVESSVWVWSRVRREPASRLLRLEAVSRHCQAAAVAIDAGQFDVLFANTCWVTASPPVARYATTPAVLYLQEPKRSLYEAGDDPAFASPPPPGKSRLAPWYIRSLARDRLNTAICRQQVRDEWKSAKAYRRILVNSYFSRESVLRAYGLSADVCYLGIDPRAFVPADSPARDYLIGVGSVTPSKNIVFAIRAVGDLTAPRPRLIWVGNSVEPGYLAELQSLARQLGVEFDARLLVPQAELTALLGNALAMVYAPRLEPFGYAPLEANACGTPVVAVAEGGVRETVRDEVNGLVVAPRPEAMAAAVRRLQLDTALADRLGRTGRRVVETEWSLAAATDLLETALTEVAAEGAGR